MIPTEWLHALASPDADDATVAAFADWLEERGESDQAETIRTTSPDLVRGIASAAMHLPTAFRSLVAALQEAGRTVARTVQAAMAGSQDQVEQPARSSEGA